jgi:hypothetical protein
MTFEMIILFPTSFPTTVQSLRLSFTIAGCTLGATSLLSMSVILLMLSDMMPKSPDAYPVIGSCQYNDNRNIY